MIGLRRTLLAGTFATALLSSATAHAEPDPVASCNKAYAEAQALASQGKFAASSEAAEVCGSVNCPQALRDRCAKMLATGREHLARIVLTLAASETTSLRECRVELDRQSSPAIAGVILTDPGAHEVLVTHPDGRKAAFTIEHVGPSEEKRLTVAFAKPRAKATAADDRVPPPSSAASESPVVPSPRSDASDTAETIGRPSRRTWPFYTGVGIGAAGLVGTVVFAAMRSSDRRCAPACSDAQVATFRRDGTLMGVGIGTAVVGAALAVTFYLVDQPMRTSRLEWDGTLRF
jgi:hypothetical protein